MCVAGFELGKVERHDGHIEQPSGFLEHSGWSVSAHVLSGEVAQEWLG